MKYTDIVLANQSLRLSQSTMQSRKVAVVSNITVAQITEFLEYVCRRESIAVELEIGEYDNIVQDAERFAGSDVVCVFLEAANILDGLQYRYETMTQAEQEAVDEKVRREIDHVINYLRDTPLVVFNKFSALAFSTDNLRPSAFESFVERLNNYLCERVFATKQANILLIDLDKVLAKIGIGSALDYRYYHSSKALYTMAFYGCYANHILPAIMSLAGRSKKVLMLDCDNTLWFGILGEDGVLGIEMTSDTAKGSVFREVQHLFKSMARKGAIVGLVSKNNPKDVDDLIVNDSRMVLGGDDIAIKKVNWVDKPTNLKNAAKELNVGLDSFIFVDDSSFEIEAVRAQCAMVQAEQVPQNLPTYPDLVRKIAARFFSLSKSEEDKERTRMYKESSAREEAREGFDGIDSYLRSLSLSVEVRVNDLSLIPRVAQLTQKTNQFNLTTKRYTENDIRNFVTSGAGDVYTCSLSDRFGDYGVVGVCIMIKNDESNTGEVDSLLMSCRALGRNVEKAFFGYIIEDFFKKNKVTKIVGSFLPTEKNLQVDKFYLSAGFSVLKESPVGSSFYLSIDDKANIVPDYIFVGVA